MVVLADWTRTRSVVYLGGSSAAAARHREVGRAGRLGRRAGWTLGAAAAGRRRVSAGYVQSQRQDDEHEAAAAGALFPGRSLLAARHLPTRRPHEAVCQLIGKSPRRMAG